MINKNLFSFSYLPLTIELECLENTNLPGYLGSALRGALGWKLVKTPFIYNYLFENRSFQQGKPDVVNPYFLNVPRKKINYKMHDILTFEIVLLGNAAQMGDLLIQTLSRTTILGLGVKRSKFKLKSIIQTANGNILWTWNQGLLKNAEIMMYDSHPFISCHFCSIQLKTPVRIRRDGELLLDFDFSTIIRNITQRIQAVTLGYGGSFDVKTAMLVNEKATFITNINTYLQRKDLARYSNKKEKTLDLSGMLGVMTAEGNLNEFVPWLLAAEMIHIGRNTTFGLGQISVVID